MDGTRDRPPGRMIETWARRTEPGAVVRGAPRKQARRHVSLAAAAPAAAPDMLIDVTSQPAPLPLAEAEWAPPHKVAEPRPSAEGPPRANPRRSEPRPWSRPVVALALGAVAALVLALAGMLLFAGQEEPEAAPAATAAALPETVAAPAVQAVAPDPAPQPAAPVVPTVHLRIGPDLPAEQRARIEEALATAGYQAVVIHEMPFTISRSRVGYFREEDRPAAEALKAALAGTHDGLELRDYGTLVTTPEAGRLDLWIRS